MNTLDKIKDGDSIVINFSTRGCYYISPGERLTIVNNKNNFIATLYEEHLDTSTQALVWRYTLRCKMTPGHQAAFKRFENELRVIKEDRCSDVDYYEIIVGGGPKREFNDGSCLWAGFYHLKRSLLKKEYSRFTFPPGYEPE